MTTTHDIARWRLASQHLVAPHAPSGAAVVEGLLAVQAENRGQTAWALACRTTQPGTSDLAGLVDSGAVVRTHVLRPTWHLVASADIAWLLELTAPRIRPSVLRQLTDRGWTGADLERALEAVVAAVTARPDLTRGQVAEELAARGLTVAGPDLAPLLCVAELDRLVCSGRWSDTAHTYALFADRVPAGPRPDRDEALAELARRYFAGHGPATERDLAYWATLPLGDVRRGLDGARDRLECFEHEGRTFWHAPGGTAPHDPPRPAGHLLQILDETYRGYQDSRMVLDVAGVVPGGRETALGMAIVDAQLVGRMKRTIGARARFEVEPYRPLAAGEITALEDAATRYGEFLGLEHELRLGQ